MEQLCSHARVLGEDFCEPLDRRVFTPEFPHDFVINRRKTGQYSHLADQGLKLFIFEICIQARESGQGRLQRFDIERLGKELVCGIQAAGDLGLIAKAGDNNARAAGIELAYNPHQLNPIHAGHAQIRQHHVKGGLFHQPQRLFGIGCAHSFPSVGFSLQHHEIHLTQERIVIGERGSLPAGIALILILLSIGLARASETANLRSQQRAVAVTNAATPQS